DPGAEFLLAAGETLHDVFTLTADEPTLRAAISALEDFVAAADGDPRRDKVAKLLAMARDRVGDPLNVLRATADLANARWELERTAERAKNLLTATDQVAAAVQPGHPEHLNLVCNVANAAVLVANLTDEPAACARALTAARAAMAVVQDAAEPNQT